MLPDPFAFFYLQCLYSCPDVGAWSVITRHKINKLSSLLASLKLLPFNQGEGTIPCDLDGQSHAIEKEYIMQMANKWKLPELGGVRGSDPERLFLMIFPGACRYRPPHAPHQMHAEFTASPPGPEIYTEAHELSWHQHAPYWYLPGLWSSWGRCCCALQPLLIGSQTRLFPVSDFTPIPLPILAPGSAPLISSCTLYC